MALTRIKTDQITDLAVTNAKIDNYTIEGGKLADNLTYGSSLTISGNLIVNGTTTTIDTTNTVAADPLIVLNRNAAGANGNDIGLIFERGASTNVAMIYDESADEFAFVSTTESGSTVGNVSITAYSTLRTAITHAGNLRIDTNQITATDTNGNIIITPDGSGIVRIEASIIGEGDLQIDGNVTLGNASGDGHLITGNVQITNGLNVSGGNNTMAGNLSVDGNVTLGNNTTDGHTISGVVTGSGQFNYDNIRIDDNTISTTNTNGSLTLDPNGTGNVVVATGAEFRVTDLTQSRVVVVGANGALKDSSNFTFDTGTGNLVVSGQLNADNLRIDGNTLSSTNTNGNIDITANGTGIVNIDNIAIDSNTISTTNTDGSLTLDPNGTGNVVVATGAEFRVTDLTATRVVFVGTSGALKDSSNFTFDTSTGNLVVSGQLNADNLRIDGNTLSSTNTNGNINITANGSGIVNIDNLAIDGNSISSTDTNGNINLTPNGSGIVKANSDLVITGNITVQGTTTTVDSTVSRVVDPIFQIGGGVNGASLSSDDGKDRGVGAKYYSGADKTAFFGYDNSTGEFLFVPDATISAEVVSGTPGTAHFGNVKVDSLTSGRVVYVGASDNLIDSSNLTFDGSTLTITGTATVSSQLNAANLRLDGNTLSSTNTNGNIDITTNGTGTVNVDNIILDGNSIKTLNADGSLTLDPNGTGNVVVATGAEFRVTDLTATRVVFAGTSGALKDSSNFTFDTSTGNLVVTGQFNADNLRIDGNTLSSTDTNGNIDITANGTGTVNVDNIILDGNSIRTLNSNGSLTLDPNGTGNVVVASGAELRVSDLTATRVVFVGTSGALKDNGNFVYNSGTGAVTVTGSLNVDNVTVNGNVISTNVTNDDLYLTPNGTGKVIMDNVQITGDDITTSGGTLTINSAGADVNFRVYTDGNNNTLFVDGGNNNVGILTATPNAETALHINSTGAMIIPSGVQADRPATPVQGMFRFNTTSLGLEYYDGSDWSGTGSTFTIASSQTYTGDGSTTSFTLSAASTSAASLVSINGVLQIPITAYGITGTTLTFTEAPEAGDVIEVRKLVATTTVVALSSADGKATVEVERTAGDNIVRFTANTTDRVQIDGSVGSGTAATLDLMNGTKTTYDQTVVSAGTSATVIDSFAKATYRSAKYIVQVANSGATAWETSEVLVIHNGTTATMIEYGVISTSGSSLGTISTVVNGSNVELKYTGVSSGNSVKVYATYIKA